MEAPAPQDPNAPGFARLMPEQPIDRFLRPVVRYMHIEATSGVVLVLCTLIALIAANSPFAESYLAFWETKVVVAFGSFNFEQSLHHVINDGLMSIFFFVIGLEVKREIVHGTLSDWRQASLPIAAALGGMLIPAGLYLAVQYGEPGMRGWGIPMATDIAFVIGCLAILGPRVPHSLRMLLLSLAIVDDIGAILVIAIGYTESLSGNYLLLAAIGTFIIHTFSRIGVRNFLPYIIVGTAAWLALHDSGIHATLAGVVLGLMTPAKPVLLPERFRDYLRDKKEAFEDSQWNLRRRRADVVREVQRLSRETVSPLEYLETTLHPWSAYFIMPIFALANAGVSIDVAHIGDSVALAVMLGLVVGKPLGIVLFSWLAIRVGWAKLPHDIHWPVLFAGGCLAGIGFTMALFIEGLAFRGAQIETAKIGILVGSAVSALLGMSLLLWTLRKSEPTSQETEEVEPVR